MNSAYRMVIDDPQKMYLLTKDMQKIVLKAAINTVNIQAAMARKAAVFNAKTEMTMRNTFSVRQIQFTKCNPNIHRLQQVQSVVGATEKAPWMERQEEGGERKPKSGNSLIIPGTAARGGSNARTVSKDLYYKRIRKKVIKGPYKRPGTRGSNLVASAFIAKKEGLYLKIGEKLYQITGFERKGNGVVFTKKLIYNLAYKSTTTPENRWLEPATKKPAEIGQKIFNKELAKASKAS